jgi:hypothetical protein
VVALDQPADARLAIDHLGFRSIVALSVHDRGPNGGALGQRLRTEACKTLARITPIAGARADPEFDARALAHKEGAAAGPMPACGRPHAGGACRDVASEIPRAPLSASPAAK